MIHRKQVLLIIGLVILLIAIPATAYLVRQTQIFKSRAAFTSHGEFLDLNGSPLPQSSGVAQTNSTSVKLKIVAVETTPEPTASSTTSPSSSGISLGPAAPTNLEVAIISESQVNLSWTPVTGATSYSIYKCVFTGIDSPDCLPLVQNPPVIVTAAAASDANLTCSANNYGYAVKAVNQDGESALSDPVFTTTCSINTMVPTILTVTTAGDGHSLVINFGGYSLATHYKIYRCLGVGCDPKSQTTPVNTVLADKNFYLDPGAGLTCGSDYSYAMKAVYTTGDSNFSNVVSSKSAACL